MPLQRFSLTPTPDAWEALLDYSHAARVVYAHLVLGRLAERNGLLCCRRRTIERDLSLKGTELNAAFADMMACGVADVSDLGDGRVVVALLHYGRIVPPQPNNRRAWQIDAQQVPDCPAKESWSSAVMGDAQLPEHTGGRLSPVNHPSLTRESPVNHPSLTRASPDQSRADQIRSDQIDTPPTPRLRGERKPSKRTSFVPPSVEDVAAYMLEREPVIGDAAANVEANAFVDHFTSNGWRIGGRTAMKDWQAAVRTWTRNDYGGRIAKARAVPNNFDTRALARRVAIERGYDIID